MSKVITVPVTAFTSHEKLAQTLNEAVADKNVRAISFNQSSLLKGEYEIYINEPKAVSAESKTIIIERPAKFKQNTTSQYYCVYKKGNGWTYKFLNTKLNPKPFLGKVYDNELDATLAYDKHRFSVEGDLSKLNFPERYAKG